MNTIKFSRKQNLTAEQHNMELADIKERMIFRKKFQLYTPCNLILFVTERCQNDCYFCINKRTNADLGVREMTDEAYINGLVRLFEEIDPDDFEVTITGGEPTLDAYRFVQTMRLCKKYGLRCRTVSTTGINLLSLYEGKPLCQHMLENGFVNNINISRMHYDEEMNQEVFRGQNLSNEEIQKLALFYRLNDAEMRVSCNLMEGYIDNFDKVMDYIGFYTGVGVETVIFRELAGCGNLTLQNIVGKRICEFEYIRTLHGMVYDADVYSHGGMLIKHYRTCKEINQDIVYSLSYKNGSVRDGFSGKRLDVRLGNNKK